MLILVFACVIINIQNSRVNFKQKARHFSGWTTKVLIINQSTFFYYLSGNSQSKLIWVISQHKQGIFEFFPQHLKSANTISYSIYYLKAVAFRFNQDLQHQTVQHTNISLFVFE